MTEVFSVSFAESAVRDLEELLEYYKAQFVPEVGRRLIAEIIAAVEELNRFPDRGRIVPEFNQPLLRELLHPPFRIVNRHDAAGIRIVRVWRSERLLQLP